MSTVPFVPAAPGMLQITEPAPRPLPDLTWQERLERLRRHIEPMGRVVVAYSGGVDSSVVLRAAFDVLGDRAHGVIGRSDFDSFSRLKSFVGGSDPATSASPPVLISGATSAAAKRMFI